MNCSNSACIVCGVRLLLQDDRLVGGPEPVLQIQVGGVSVSVARRFAVEAEEVTVNIHPVALQQTPSVLRLLVQQEIERMQQLQAAHLRQLAEITAESAGSRRQQQQQQQVQQREQQQPHDSEDCSSKGKQTEETFFPHVDILVKSPRVHYLARDFQQQQQQQQQQE